MKNKKQNSPKKTKLKLLIILAVAVFIFLSGCTGEPIKPNTNLGCCDPDIAKSPTDPRCQLKNPGDGVELKDSISCDQDSNTCDVMITINDGPPEQETMPVCTAMEALSCIQNTCNAQVCGPFTYSPEIIISHRDTVQLQEDLEEEEKSDVDIAGEKQSEAQNTYGTTCMVLPTDENLTNVFTNTKGSFVNSFRFGLGKSFQEFEKYRFMFPFSDDSCNVNPFPNAKERYANYLKTEDEDIEEVFADSFDQITYCPQDFRSPFRNDLYGGETANPPNYKMETIKRFATNVDNPLLEFKTFDRDFYDHILRWLYRADFPDETIPLKEPIPATFECVSGPQCKSGNCDFDFYSRGMCQKEDESWANCQCLAGGRECAGETVWTPKSKDVSTLDDAIERYNDGGELYYSIQRKVDFYYHNFNPDCGSTTDTQDDGIWYCQGTKCYEYNEPDNDALVFDADNIITVYGDEGWDVVDELRDYHLKCSGSEGSINTCTSKENDKTKFDLYRTVGGGYVKPSEDSLYSVNHYEDDKFDPYRNILLADEDKITDFITDDDEWGDEHEVAKDAFPNKIFFFGEQRSATPPSEDDDKWPIWDNAIGSKSYIGYTLLSPQEFRKTNFFQACELDDSSFDKVEFKPRLTYWYYNGVNHVSPGHINMQGPGGSYWNYLDYMYEDAPIIPLIFPGYGFKPIQSASCSTFGSDNFGKYWYTRYILFLKDAGKCKLDDNFRPVTRGFGWCEGCSYLTLAQHQVKAQEEYSYLSENRYRNSDATEPSDFTTICAFGICSYDDKISFPTLNADPETIFLLQKEEQYLREGVLPVLDLTDSSNWDGAKIVTEDSIVEKGPTILIVDKVNSEFDNSDVDRIKSRAEAAKQVCGKCLVSFSIDNGASGSLGGKERMAKDRKVVRDMSAELKQMTNVDIISIKLYPHEFAKEDTQLCDDKSSFFNTVVDELSNFGSTALVYGKKFTLVNKMFVDTNVLPGCWEGTGGSDLNEDPLYRLFAGIAFRQRTFTQTGVIGMIYSETSGLTEPTTNEFGAATTYSEQYCSLEKAARLLVSDPAITIYKKLPLQPADSPNVACKECTALDISLSQCDLRCENGRECDKTDIPAGKENTYRCPPDVFPEESIPCSEVKGSCSSASLAPLNGFDTIDGGVTCADNDPMLNCTVLYGDGTIDIQTYRISDLNEQYPDVIASMPKYYKCNVEDDSGNYSYTKFDLKGKTVAPIIFSYTNPQTEDCGVPDYNALIPMQCGGAVFPIKNYRIQCKFLGDPPEPWPPSQCNDGMDNDNDGRIDIKDTGCSSSGDNSELSTVQCDDGIDNDGDGKTDYRAGVDLDGDGKLDYTGDLGCSSRSDDSERAEVQCDDGIDNDGDGLIDYPDDLGCGGSLDPDEINPQCMDSVDNDGDGKIDYPDDPNCYSEVDPLEATPQCSDSIDNDGNGLTDHPDDPNCYGSSDELECPGGPLECA